MPVVPHAERSVELRMPPALDLDGVIGALRRHAEIVAEPPRFTDRVYLDTFDGRLHAAGLTLWRPATEDGGVTLTLEEAHGPPRTVRALPSRRDRIVAGDLAAGAVRDRLLAVIDQRALLPHVRVRSRDHPLGVRDTDGKTVVRVVVEQPALVRPKRPSASLGCRVRIVGVLGYPRAFTRVRKWLDADLGLTPAPTAVVAEATAAAGLPVAGVSSTVGVALDPAMRADHASILICRRLADIVEANLPGACADIDAEFLHDLRVAVRRTRSVLKEITGILPPAGTERARADLRWIQEITGPTRDLDVQLESWPTVVWTVSPTMTGDLGGLHDLLARHRAAEFALMRRRLRGQRFDRAWRAWRELLDQPPSTDTGGNGMPIREAAGRRIAAVHRGIVRRGSAIDDTSAPGAIHDLRKRGKELRYLLELFADLWPVDAVKPLVSTLKGLQDVLGRFQDDEVQIRSLRGLEPELAVLPGGTDSLIALGLVIDGLAEDQRRARNAFAERFAPFAAARTRKLVAAAFGGQPSGRSGRHP